MNDLMSRAEQVVIDTIDKANAIYNKNMRYPTVIWNLRGTTAGKACTTKWIVYLHPNMLQMEGDKYLDRTPIHEVAHLVDKRVNGTQRTMSRTGKMRFVSHGATWKSVMRNLGLDPKRCHNYQSAKVLKQRRRKGDKFEYKCSCRTMVIGATQHRRAMQGTKYRCNKCKSPIEYVGLVAFSS